MSLEVPTVACPDPTNAFVTNRLNPLSPNPSSQVSFSSPSLSNFPNNANVQLAYRYSNFDVTPPVSNQLLTTIQSTQQTHSLNNLPCGSNTVTVTATDNAGNTATCTFTYFRLLPTVACPDPTNAFAQNRLNPLSPNPSSQVSFSSPSLSSFPNNANVQLAYRYSNFDVTPPVNNQLLTTIQSTQQTHSLNNLPCGSNTVTVTATDNAGNTATCTFTYFRLCVVCPNPVSSTQTSTSFARPTFNFPLGAVVTYTYTYNGQDIGTFQFNQATTHFLQGFQVGTNTVTLTVRDTNGNAVTCTYNYIVTANLLITCPPNQNSQVSCGQGTSFLTFPAATAANGVGLVTITYNSGSIVFNTQNPNQVSATFPAGLTQVTATARDSTGQTVSCQFTATVTGGDQVPPSISCGQDVTSQVQCGQASTQVCFNQCTATDNLGTPTVRYSSGSIQFTIQGNQQCATYPAGVSIVTATATDNCGLTSFDTLTVTVSGGDQVPPSIFCGQDVTSQVQCGQASTQVCFNQCTATDNLGTPNVRYSSGSIQFTPQGNQQCATFPAGVSAVTATATDNCGLTSFDTLTVTVSGGDQVPPSIFCGQDVSSQVQCGQANTQVCFNQCTATDNLGTPNVRYSSGSIQFTPQGNQQCATFPAGVSAVTTTATDNCGLTSSDSLTVTVSGGDQVPPSIFCGQDVSSQVQCGQANTQVCFNQCTATDNLGTPNVRYSSGSIQFTPQGNQQCATFPAGVSAVTATATDNCGLTSSDSLTVTVSGGDQVPPSIFCGQDVSSQVQCGQANTQVCFNQCTASDNLGTPTVRYSSGSIQFIPQGNQQCATFPAGVSAVTATATDNCGLTSSDTLTVTVSGGDQVPPSIFCGQDVSSQVQCGQANTQVCFNQCTATDNLGAPNVRYSSGSIQFAPQGNQQCATFPAGVSTVTATATDNCGLTSSDTLTVTVSGGDQVPPSIFCGQDVSSQVQCGQANTQVCFNQCTATDNSGTPNVRYNSGLIQFAPQGNQICATYPAGVTSVTATATDNCGLTSSDTLTVTVTGGDQVPPSIFCGQDVSSQVQCGQANTQVCFNQCTATDNLGTPNVRYSSGSIQFTPQGNQQCATYPAGVSTVTATATDNCGLTSSDTLTVTVTGGDQVPPSIFCGQDVRSQVQCGQANTQVCFNQCTATDNLGTPNVRYNSGLIQFTPQGNQICATYPAGVTSVTATATDNCGLTSTDTLTVTVTGDN
ncbi:hyalin-like [Amphiura filiformis]|uniref:hyalin-like n=1 Tax=Amphiura filiformis TaxID=82378 RepID=UPI003B21B541